MSNISNLINKSNKSLGHKMNVIDATFSVDVTAHIASFSIIDKDIIPANFSKMLRETSPGLSWTNAGCDEAMIASWFHKVDEKCKVCTTMFIADKNTSKDYDVIKETARKIAKGKFKGSKGVWYLIKSDELKAPYE